MPTYKVSHFYEFQTSGWQEVFYVTADTPQLATNLTDQELTQLLAMRARGVLFKAARAVEVYNPRVGILRPYQTRRGFLIQGLDLGEDNPRLKPDVAGTSLYARLEGTTGPSRPVFLRGLRDDVVNRDFDGAPDFSNVRALFGQWLTVIKHQPAYQIRATRPASNPTAAPKKVIQVSTVVEDTVDCKFAPADYAALVGSLNTVFSGGTVAKVIVAGGNKDAHNLPGLRGIFNVISTDAVANTVRISYTLPAGVVGAQVPVKMTVRNLYYSFANITDGSMVDFRTRDTGRPTNLRRGRSRAVQFRH
jgi:hypothetical protein